MKINKEKIKITWALSLNANKNSMGIVSKSLHIIILFVYTLPRKLDIINSLESS